MVFSQLFEQKLPKIASCKKVLFVIFIVKYEAKKKFQNKKRKLNIFLKIGERKFVLRYCSQN